ncbi:24063_t:CDS:2 [Gigaspora rosea]|nr:24063_t:CDS:2 [Gigaspora rosea]
MDDGHGLFRDYELLLGMIEPHLLDRFFGPVPFLNGLYLFQNELCVIALTNSAEGIKVIGDT